MGAFDGLYPVRRRLQSAHIEHSWTVEYDTGEMRPRICGLPPEMGRQTDTFYSEREAYEAAEGKQNVVIEHYEEKVYDH